MRLSPARIEAPEPDVWLPILDVTGELEAIDVERSGEVAAITGDVLNGDVLNGEVLNGGCSR